MRMTLTVIGVVLYGLWVWMMWRNPLTVIDGVYVGGPDSPGATEGKPEGKTELRASASERAPTPAEIKMSLSLIEAGLWWNFRHPESAVDLNKLTRRPKKT